ncbi:MAG: OmpA family protein [Gemmatimonadetes bacterium]|nr:OmpA family protein [Gemmatimonadota bacterium]
MRSFAVTNPSPYAWGSARPSAWIRRLRAALVVLLGLSSGACIKTSTSLDQAAGALARDLARQLGPQLQESETLVIDPMVDRATGQQTGASLRLQEVLTDSLLAGLPDITIVGLSRTSIDESRLLLAGTLTTVPDTVDQYTASVSLTDRDVGLVVAQAAARFEEAELDQSPTPFFDESPSLTRDRSVEGYLTTAETRRGRPADALYLDQLSTTALLTEALERYNEGSWSEALERYQAAADRPDGQQLRTFNGIYLTSLKLNRVADAEEAFGRIVSLGLATDNLAVKLLFRPGSTDFWPSAEVSGMYPMWLRRIAEAAASSGSCLNIMGHTSRSGSEELNDRLSLQRAERVAELLEANADLAGQLRATGRGFRDNIVGTGRDDASDAIDRRVEFSVVPCA